MSRTASIACFKHAKTLMPGGVSSPVRAFRGVGDNPIFIESANGSHMEDVDGNSYIDYVLSWGPMIVGHAHPKLVAAIGEQAQRGTSFGAPTRLESELAELILSYFPKMDMLRFVSSGTEATMSALRLARAATKRNKIIKFSGCYHGHSDGLITQTPDTIVLPYNDLQALNSAFKDFGDDIAGVIVEPVAGNMGFLKPSSDYLPALQHICREHGALFICDEVMTGFRVALGGAQTLFDLDPDISCFGKVIGGGLPAAAYAGKKHIMELVAPSGPVYQAGTLSGNPLAMAAGIATLKVLGEPGVFDSIAANTTALVDGLNSVARAKSMAFTSESLGTMFGVRFYKDKPLPLCNFGDIERHVDASRYAEFFNYMLKNGIYFAPSAFEAGFLSLAHTPDDIGKTIHAFDGF